VPSQATIRRRRRRAKRERVGDRKKIQEDIVESQLPCEYRDRPSQDQSPTYRNVST
jgi:hypothetical protein